MQLFNRQVSGRCLTMFGLEAALISGVIVLAAAAHGSFAPELAEWWKIVFAISIFELCFYYNDLYDLTLVHSRSEFLIRLLRATGTAAVLLAVATLIVPKLIIGPGVFLTCLWLMLLSVSVWRMVFDRLCADPRLEERVLIVGTGRNAQNVAEHIRAQHDFPYRVIGCIENSESAVDHVDLPVLGGTSDLPALVERHRIDRIIVSLSDRRSHLPIQELLQLKLSGVRVEDAATTYERLTGKILTQGLTPSWFVFSEDFRAARGTRVIKRGLDVVFALAGLILAAPLMLATALAVRLESAGPILYRQERVGERGRTFTLYKFRSMRTDAEAGVPVWASENDDRVTWVGRYIRLTRLDELPQLWNVLRGEMSFVGPRPERPYFVEQLAAAIPYYAERHVVKPGVTGWAQVKYRYGASVEDAREKLRYDLYYIKHLSILFDLTIIVDTVKVMISGRGAQ